MGTVQSVAAQTKIRPGGKCSQWTSKIDPTVANPIDSAGGTVRTDQLLDAFRCLLKLKGRKSTSIFSSGTVGLNLSTRFPAPSVEVAALYYISYLYSENWRHADAIVLVDEKGNQNTTDSIVKAFDSYESWLKTVKEVGVDEARKRKLDPLSDSGLRWY